MIVGAEISLEDSKEIQLNILRYFVSFCAEYNLQYFIAYGTLIGAVRHKGFIPWDDDIDIQMPRNDYERLIRSFHHSHDSRYCLVSPYDLNAKHTYIKLIDKSTIKIEEGVKYKDDYLGIDIDIFPLDGQPDSHEEYDKEYKKAMSLYKKLYLLQTDYRGNFKSRILLPVYRLFLGSRNSIQNKIDKLLTCNKYEESKYVGDLSNWYMYYNDRQLKEDYESGILVDFEGMKVCAPVGYDRILKTIYGDYMKLPPKEEQMTHHTYKLYWSK